MMMEELQKIKKVDAPPFLLTRIQAKIRIIEAETTPLSWRWAGAMGLCALLTINVFLFVGTEKKQDSNGAQSLAEGMKLQSDNQLYHE